MTLTLHTDEVCNHIKPLYIITQFDGQPFFKILVDNIAILKVFLVFILRKMSKKKSDILPTDLIMANFYGTTTQPLGILSIGLTVRYKMTETILFVIDVVTTYNALLGQEWIHASRCIPSSLH